MTKLAHGAWVVVADGKKALLFRNKGDALYINLELIEEIHQDNPPTHEQGSDRPTTVYQSVGASRSSAEATDWHQAGEDRFAHRLADDLHVRAREGKFEQLVLVAPPRMLGVLRHALHPELRKRIIAESDKTLTQHPTSEIERMMTRL
jgi:protein required for attachment to host cells